MKTAPMMGAAQLVASLPSWTIASMRNVAKLGPRNAPTCSTSCSRASASGMTSDASRSATTPSGAIAKDA